MRSGGRILGVVDGLEQFLPGLVEAPGGFIVADGVGDCIELLERGAGLEEGRGAGERFELLIGVIMSL